MNLSELIKLARIRLRDRQLPYLWDDETLTEFANSAVAEACFRARVLKTAVQLPVLVGVGTYTLPFTVLSPKHGLFVDASGVTAVAGTFISGSWYTIASIGTTDFKLVGATTNTVGHAFKATGAGVGTGTATFAFVTPLPHVSQDEVALFLGNSPTSVGRPLCYSRANLDNSISIYPTPNIAGTFTADIARMPSDLEVMVSGTDSPAMPLEFHRDLVYWMQAEAYIVDDTDKGNAKRAEDMEKKFESRFGRKPTVRGEIAGRLGVVGADMIARPFGGVAPQRLDNYIYNR
jgi:hypothetical protein